MQTYDFLMLFVLLGTTLFGFVKGLAWQVAYLASLVVSYFVALRFSTQLAPMFGESEPFNRYVAMLAIYVGTSFAIWMIFRVVAGTIDRVKLKEFDRQMGALIGFARGVLWCIAITFFAATLLESYRPAILGSRSGHYIAVLLDKTHELLPSGIHEVVHPYVQRIEQGLDPNQPAQPPWPLNGESLGGQSGGQGGGAATEGQGGGWPNSSSSNQPSNQPWGGSPPAGNQPPAETPWGGQSSTSSWPEQQPGAATPWLDDNPVPAQPVSNPWP